MYRQNLDFDKNLIIFDWIPPLHTLYVLNFLSCSLKIMIGAHDKLILIVKFQSFHKAFLKLQIRVSFCTRAPRPRNCPLQQDVGEKRNVHTSSQHSVQIPPDPVIRWDPRNPRPQRLLLGLTHASRSHIPPCFAGKDCLGPILSFCRCPFVTSSPPYTSLC